MLTGRATCCCLVLLAAACPQSADGQTWTQFEMNRCDADGRFLWTEAENWTKGLPDGELCVEIGDDHSGKALHCVIPADCEAVCSHFELAEHARTQGTTLRLEKDATLTPHRSVPRTCVWLPAPTPANGVFGSIKNMEM